MTKREQVAQQYRAVVHLARQIATVHAESASIIPVTPEGVIEIMGERSARLMETLGDVLNGMDATETEDEWLDTIYDEAHAMFPAQPSLPVEAAGAIFSAIEMQAKRDLPMALQFVRQYSDEVWRLCQLGHLNSRSKLADITLDARAFLDDLSDKGAVPAPPADAPPKRTLPDAINLARQSAGLPTQPPLVNDFPRCNRHKDCEQAEKDRLARNPGTLCPVNFHCHDDECEQCFGN